MCFFGFPDAAPPATEADADPDASSTFRAPPACGNRSKVPMCDGSASLVLSSSAEVIRASSGRTDPRSEQIASAAAGGAEAFVEGIDDRRFGHRWVTKVADDGSFEVRDLVPLTLAVVALPDAPEVFDPMGAGKPV